MKLGSALLLLALLSLLPSFADSKPTYPVDVCVNGRNRVVSSKVLRKARARGWKLGRCRAGNGVTICHKQKENMVLNQQQAYWHLITHGRDYFGRCMNTGRTQVELLGKNFQVTRDLNQQKYLKATLMESAEEEDEANVTFYATKTLDFSLKSLDMITVEKKSVDFVIELDGLGRPHKYTRMNGDGTTGFAMIVDFADHSDYVTFTVEMKHELYTGAVHLDEVYKKRRVRQLNDKPVSAERTTRRSRNLRRRTQALTEETVRRVHVEVSSCKFDYEDASLKLDYSITKSGAEVEGSVMSKHLGKGVYEFMVPVEADTDRPSVRYYCWETIADMEAPMKQFKNALQVETAEDREAFCKAIGSEISLLGTASGGAIVKGCNQALNATREAYTVFTPANPFPDYVEWQLPKAVCSDDLDFDTAFSGTGWTLKPKLIYPFDTKAGSLQPFSGLVADARTTVNLEKIDLSNGQPSIDKVWIDPSAPLPGEGYKFNAEVWCVDEDEKDKVYLSYAGTDRYKGVTKCSVPNKKMTTCSMTVSGGKAGVVDTCMVEIKPHGITKTLGVLF